MPDEVKAKVPTQQFKVGDHVVFNDKAGVIRSLPRFSDPGLSLYSVELVFTGEMAIAYGRELSGIPWLERGQKVKLVKTLFNPLLQDLTGVVGVPLSGYMPGHEKFIVYLDERAKDGLTQVHVSADEVEVLPAITPHSSPHALGEARLDELHKRKIDLGRASAALELLEALRNEVPSDTEDKILEVMDILVGWWGGEGRIPPVLPPGWIATTCPQCGTPMAIPTACGICPRCKATVYASGQYTPVPPEPYG